MHIALGEAQKTSYAGIVGIPDFLKLIAARYPHYEIAVIRQLDLNLMSTFVLPISEPEITCETAQRCMRIQMPMTFSVITHK